MPDFECLGKIFVLSQADLDRAPGCVLVEAWAASSGQIAVSLNAWPEPDLDVLLVAAVSALRLQALLLLS